MNLAKRTDVRPIRLWLPVVLLIATALGVTPALAQPASAPAESRAAALAQAKAEKTKTVHAYEPKGAEKWLDRAETLLLRGGLHFHPFFDSAYAGGGFTLGAGYRRFVSPYNTIDVRGSLTLSGYKRVEAEFLAPRLFNRRGVLSVVGGWREATQVGFYGIGTTETTSGDRANYSFTQPYVSTRIAVLAHPPAVRRSAAGSSDRSGIRRPGSGTVPVGRGRSTRRRPCPVLAPSRPTCTRRVRRRSTGGPRRATRGAAAVMG